MDNRAKQHSDKTKKSRAARAREDEVEQLNADRKKSRILRYLESIFTDSRGALKYLASDKRGILYLLSHEKRGVNVTFADQMPKDVSDLLVMIYAENLKAFEFLLTVAGVDYLRTKYLATRDTSSSAPSSDS